MPAGLGCSESPQGRVDESLLRMRSILHPSIGSDQDLFEVKNERWKIDDHSDGEPMTDETLEPQDQLIESNHLTLSAVLKESSQQSFHLSRLKSVNRKCFQDEPDGNNGKG